MWWTDGKVELLLDTVKDFKAEKSTKLSVGCPLKTSMSKLKKGSLEIFLMARKVRNTHIALQFLDENILRPKLNNSVQIIGRHYILKERVEEEG